MRTFLKYMKKRQKEVGVSDDVMSIFDGIISDYFVPGRGSHEGDNRFRQAMHDHLTYEQRIKLWEKSGGCTGSAREKARKEFAVRNADIPLQARLELFIMELAGNREGKTRDIVLNEQENTIVYTFACTDCFKHHKSGRSTAPLESYYESCAGGRMQNMEEALGIKLHIESVFIPPEGIGVDSPCVFTYSILG